jgi:hypothetical protein
MARRMRRGDGPFAIFRIVTKWSSAGLSGRTRPADQDRAMAA